MEREGAAVTCDGRLFHRRAAATGNVLSPTVDRRVRRTSRDVDEAERIVVVWLQCLLVDVVRRTGTL